MKPNFTLRRVALQYRNRRDAQRYDVVFRNGRLTNLRALPEDGPPQLYLTPGYWDAHLHLLHLGMGRHRLDLSATTSVEEALQAVATFSRERAPGTVVWGVGWDETRWREGRAPVREEIDHWVADRPVIMRRICGHLAILNSPALTVARQRWPDLGHAGRLVEEQAMELATLWPESHAERCEALREVQRRALSLGITRVSEMGSSGAVDAYLELQARGELRLAVELCLPATAIARAIELRDTQRFDDERLRLGGIKLFADGSVGARTAAFLEGYADRQGSGTLLYPDHALYELLARCRAADLRVRIHAIGDAALRQVLRQLERLVSERGPLPPCWAGLEHAELLTPSILDRAARLQLRISMQPNFVAQWGQAGGLYERALGRERWLRMNPFREVWDRGVAFVFGSDGMPMDPVRGLQGAVQHPVAGSRLTSEEALMVYLGGRGEPAGFWEPDDWWREGCSGAVIYERDPLLLGTGDQEAAPIVAVLWDGEWIVTPPEGLQRSGVLHVD